MGDQHKAENLSRLLDRLEQAAEGREEVSIGDIRDCLGDRSFGPFLLCIGLIGATPASGIPTFPSIIGIVVLLTAGQMVVGIRHFWLPDALLRRSLSCERFCKAIGYLRWPARLMDKVVRPRLTFLTRWPLRRVLAICCCLIAITTPPLEFVPLTSAIPAAIIALFGLALTTEDGVVAILALIGFAVFVAALVWLGSGLLT